MRAAILRLIKYAFFAGIFLFIILTALTNIGGSSDVLKEAIEDFITDNSAFEARIETLHNMNFFPDIVIDFENLSLRSKESTQQAIHIAKVKISMGFFDVMFRTQKYKIVDVENANVVGGVLFNRPFLVSSIKILDDSNQPRLVVIGKIGLADFVSKFQLQSKGGKYYFGEQWAFENAIGTAHVLGTMQKNPDGDLRIDAFKADIGGEPVLEGALDFTRLGHGGFNFKGPLTLYPNKDVLDSDIKLVFGNGPLQATGAINAQTLHLESLSPQSTLGRLLDYLLTIPDKTLTPEQSAATPPDISGFDFDIDMKADQILTGETVWGNASSKAVVRDSKLTAGPLSGKIAGGDLTGSLSFDAAQQPLKWVSRFDVKNFDYAELAKITDIKETVTGKGDLVINLSASAPTVSTLGQAMVGEITFAGGKSELPMNVLDFWAKDFGKTLLLKTPDGKPLVINCALLDLGIKDQKAQIDSFFIDANGFSIQGNGTYDLRGDKMDAVLHPGVKEGASGFATKAVNLTGKIENLDVKSSGFDAGSGGLSGSALAPSAPSLSLRNITLPADHPCSALVIQSEVLAPPPVPAVATPAP
jgi:hypothetical protein